MNLEEYVSSAQEVKEVLPFNELISTIHLIHLIPPSLHTHTHTHTHTPLYLILCGWGVGGGLTMGKTILCITIILLQSLQGVFQNTFSGVLLTHTRGDCFSPSLRG